MRMQVPLGTVGRLDGHVNSFADPKAEGYGFSHVFQTFNQCGKVRERKGIQR